jgi:hypothetical protein
LPNISNWQFDIQDSVFFRLGASHSDLPAARTAADRAFPCPLCPARKACNSKKVLRHVGFFAQAEVVKQLAQMGVSK